MVSFHMAVALYQRVSGGKPAKSNGIRYIRRHGGVSIHGGMDPYALFYVHELCDLAEYTGNDQWHQRASAIWRNGQQAISEGDYVLDGKAPRPVEVRMKA